ncbi:MAG: cation:proton antiporter [Theionarchaea archaeon]|nr:cation:proton antiporter [Theionarchaea archaeon]
MLIFIHVIVIVTAAIICGNIMERLGQPNIIGELLGGILVGPVALFLFSIPFGDHPLLEYWNPDQIEREITILIDIGMVMVMLIAGLGTELEELIKSSRYSLSTAVGGVIFPFLLGYGTGRLFHYEWITCLFLGASLSITAVAVSAKSLYDLNLLRTRIGSTVMGAAVFDDVIGILILSLLLNIIKHAELPSLVNLAIIFSQSVAFLLISGVVGLRIVPRILNRLRLSKEFRLGSILLIVLTYAVAARISGLHEIIGAFVAGLILRKSLTNAEVEELVTWGFGFFGPLFFGWIGFVVRLHPLLNIFCYAVIAAACVGKIVGCGLGGVISGLSRKEALSVGVGMNGRGAVELVLAGVGLEYGVISHELFSIVVVMAFITTILTPIGLKATTRWMTETG